MTRLALVFTLASLTSGLLACSKSEDKQAKPLAESAQKLEVEKPSLPDTMTFAIDPSSSKVTFEMDAPFEKQDGTVPAEAVSGEINVVLRDFAKSTGLVTVKLDQLEIYQEKKEDEKSEFGPREKVDLQNEHMRAWLEIGEDAPAEEREKNVNAQFALQRIEDPSATDLTALTGPERKVTFTGHGEVLLHQRKSTKSGKFEATFTFDGDRPVSVKVSMLEPIPVDLDAHDVRPRTAFGKLADKTLEAMAPKVGKEARISAEFTAKTKE